MTLVAAGMGERARDLVGEVGNGERLADDLGFASAGERGVIDIAGHEQNRQTRPHLGDGARHFDAVHAGHREVDERGIDPRVAFDEIEGGTATAGLEHRIAEFRQHRRGHLEHPVVVDEQQPGTAGAAAGQLTECGAPEGFGLGLGARQIDVHDRPFAEPQLDAARRPLIARQTRATGLIPGRSPCRFPWS